MGKFKKSIGILGSIIGIFLMIGGGMALFLSLLALIGWIPLLVFGGVDALLKALLSFIIGLVVFIIGSLIYIYIK